MGLIRLWQKIEALALSVCEHVLDVFGLLDLWQIAELLEGHENTIEAGRPGALTLPDENTRRAKKITTGMIPVVSLPKLCLQAAAVRTSPARQGVTEPRAMPPETRQEQPFPTHEA
jgi:hypothetical protein